VSENNWSDKQLEELLRFDIESEPPPDLSEMIMRRVRNHRPGFRRQLWNWLHRPCTVHFRPLQLAATTAALALFFWAGMTVERNFSEDPPLAAAIAENARANYLIGRGLLAGDQVESALPFLEKAVQQDPTSAEFSHWQGVAYWALGKTELERQSYVRTVRSNPDHLPTHLYLGHNYLENGRYREALASYQRVLDRDPSAPEALYNKALVYHRLNDHPQERQAFRQYLETYRTGKWARRAVQHLQALGDYGYRLYRIGIQEVALNMSALLQSGSAAQRREIERLAANLEQNRTEGLHELHIVVYDEHSRTRARETALGLRGQLGEYLQAKENMVIRTSWFDAAETLGKTNGKKLSQSILLFTRQMISADRRNTT